VPQEGGLSRFGSSAALAQSELILTRFRAALDEIYGPGIERASCCPVHARGDAGAGSDYDCCRENRLKSLATERQLFCAAPCGG